MLVPNYCLIPGQEERTVSLGSVFFLRCAGGSSNLDRKTYGLKHVKPTVQSPTAAGKGKGTVNPDGCTMSQRKTALKWMHQSCPSPLPHTLPRHTYDTHPKPLLEGEGGGGTQRGAKVKSRGGITETAFDQPKYLYPTRCGGQTQQGRQRSGKAQGRGKPMPTGAACRCGFSVRTIGRFVTPSGIDFALAWNAWIDIVAYAISL